MKIDRIRLDKWLWHARMARTRTLAAELVRKGHIRVNGARQTNSAHGLKLGDILTISVPHGTFVVELTAFGTRRDGAEQARNLYREVGTSPPA